MKGQERAMRGSGREERVFTSRQALVENFILALVSPLILFLSKFVVILTYS